MEFRLILYPGPRFELEKVKGVDDYYPPGMICQMCQEMGETTKSEFVIEGLGLRWSTYLCPDLCMFLDDLPNAIVALLHRETFSICLAEQHMSRTIVFRADGDAYIIQCYQFIKRQWFPEEERLEAERLLQMLRKVRDDFLAYVAVASTGFADHPNMIAFFSEEGSPRVEEHRNAP